MFSLLLIGGAGIAVHREALGAAASVDDLPAVLYFGERGIAIVFRRVVDPLQHGLDVDGSGAGLARPQEGRHRTPMINIVSHAANALIPVRRNGIATGIVGSGDRLGAAPSVPDHDFVGLAVQPDVVSLVIFGVAGGTGVETTGDGAQGCHPDIDVLLVNIGIGFDAVAGVIGRDPPVMVRIGPDAFGAGSRSPDIGLHGKSTIIPASE